MSITVETCGKSYCEHYPEGLPVCAECREASTLSHDKACAKIVEARADADHWKGECNAMQCMVHEARAEIDRLRNQLEDESMRADGMTTAHAEAGAKNYRQQELIEQMRVALELTHADFQDVCKSCMFNNSYTDGHFCSKCPTKLAVARLGAALAAERGE